MILVDKFTFLKRHFLKNIYTIYYKITIFTFNITFYTQNVQRSKNTKLQSVVFQYFSL
jgi:hypothetical protein